MKTLHTLKTGLLVAILAAGAGTALAGPTVPPGSPGSTMKSLNEIPPSWHQALSATQDGDLFGIALPCDSKRFRCVLGDFAILDLETGLVWQRDPSHFIYTQGGAQAACLQAVTGGRMGWRLASANELSTLMNPQDNWALYTGNPFENTSGDPLVFWTSTVDLSNPDRGFRLYFGIAAPTPVNNTLYHRAWCVRGHGD